MPDACDGPPTVVTDKDGVVCTKSPCSLTPVCKPGGTVTPSADCLLVEDGVLFPLFYQVTIVTNNWVTDNGDRLHQEEKGCGAMTAWDPQDIKPVKSPDGTWTAVKRFSFTLPLTIKAGCVERAIASAGGPSGMQCKQATSDWVWI